MQNSEFLNFSDSEETEILSNDFFIYRIFAFDRFIDLVKSQSLTLAKPKEWDDKYENILSNCIIENDTGQKLYMSTFSTDIYAQCWSMIDESDAMWRIYSQDKKGVLVKVSAFSLLNSLKSTENIKISQLQKLFFGKVSYETEKQIKNKFEQSDFIERCYESEQNRVNTLLLKRDSFEHEKEVRFIFINKISDDSNQKFINLNIDFENIFREITLDPRLDDTDFQRQKYIIESIGYTGIIKKSSLYKIPNINLSINSLNELLGK